MVGRDDVVADFDFHDNNGVKRCALGSVRERLASVSIVAFIFASYRM